MGKEVIIIKRWKKQKATAPELSEQMFNLPTKMAEVEWSDHKSGDIG